MDSGVKPLERNVENVVVRWATERNILSLKLTPFGRRGYPDRLFFVMGGKPAFIEFKRKGEKPRPLQLHVLGILKDLGYDVQVTDNATEAIWFLEECVKRSGHERRRKRPELRRR